MELNLVNLLSVLAAAWIAGRVAERIGYPAILGELLIGIIAGPAALGLLQGDEALAVLAELGVLLMMLYIGMEIDPTDLRRASWPGLLAAIGGFVVPFVLGYLTVIAFGGEAIAGLFVGIAVGVTSLATKSRILSDLDLLDTRMAHVLMAGALLSDTATLVVFAGIIGFVQLGVVDAGAVGTVALEAVAFFIVTGVIGWKLFPLIGRGAQRLAAVSGGGRTLVFLTIATLGLLFAELAELAGLHAILGAFVAGLYMREGMFDHRTVRQAGHTLHDVSIGFLAPIFFVTAGFEVSFGVFSSDLPLLLSVMAVAFGGKILGTALFYLPSGRGWREGITVGAAMNGRGAVEIVVAGIALEAGIISTEVFSILVFMAISTTATVPLFLKWGVSWLRRHGELERAEQRRTGTIVVGAGRFGQLVAGLLPGPVTMVDVNRDNCDAAERHGLRAVCGDALDEEVLRLAGAADARTLVAVTANAEVNVLAAQLARDLFAVPSGRVLLPESSSAALLEVVTESGAERLFGAGANVGVWERRLAMDAVEVATVEIRDEAHGQELLAEGVLPLAVDRAGDRRLYTPTVELRAGDELTVLRPDAAVPDGLRVPTGG